MINGKVEVVGETLEPGDGAAISDVNGFDLRAQSDAEFLLFDLS